MHDIVTMEILKKEKALLAEDYQALFLRVNAEHLREKANRVINLQKEQIRLLEDLLQNLDQYENEQAEILRHRYLE